MCCVSTTVGCLSDGCHSDDCHSTENVMISTLRYHNVLQWYSGIVEIIVKVYSSILGTLTSTLACFIVIMMMSLMGQSTLIW